MTKIHITQFDLERLQNLIAKQPKPYGEYVKSLSSELEGAKIVEPKSIPEDVVTMNSSVRFKDESGEVLEYNLVFPEDADFTSHKISILSPIGCSLIGHRVGNTVTLPTPKGRRELTIEAIVYQPERAGDMDL